MAGDEDFIRQLNEELQTASNFAGAGQLEQASAVLRSVITRLEADPLLRHNIASIRADLIRIEVARHNEQEAKEELGKLLAAQLTEDEMRELFEMARSQTDDPEAARALLEMIEKKATTLGYSQVSILAMISTGVSYAKERNFLGARVSLILAQQSAVYFNYPKEKLLALRNLAHVHFDLGCRAQALECLMQAGLLITEMGENLLGEEPEWLERIKHSCLALDATPIFIFVLCQLLYQSRADTNRHFDRLEQLAVILAIQDDILTHATFEHAARLLIDWLTAAITKHPVEWPVMRVASLYEQAASIAVPLMQLDPSLANRFIALAETAQYYRMVVHYEAPPPMVQAKLNELSTLEIKRDQLVSDSLRRRWRLSSRSSQLREIDGKISEMLGQLSGMITSNEEITTSRFSPPLISLSWPRKDALVLGFHRIAQPAALVVYLQRPDGTLVYIEAKRIPEKTLESTLAVLGQYPEYEIDFLVELLSELLLPKPILEFLSRTTITKLTIVGDAMIQGIPWEGVEKGPLVLGCKFALTRAFTGYRLPNQLSATSVKALVVGDPTGDLTASREEAATIAQRLQESGLDVTRALSASADHLLLSTDSVQILHYAGHANFLEYEPKASYLQLSDRPVTLADIASLKIVSGALVIMNACETASMPKIDRSGNFNLIQPFFEAGASCVVGGLWPVRDGAAAQLVLEFYKYLLAGCSAADALRNARVSMRDQGLPRTQWASHAMFGQGEWQLRLPAAT